MIFFTTFSSQPLNFISFLYYLFIHHVFSFLIFLLISKRKKKKETRERNDKRGKKRKKRIEKEEKKNHHRQLHLNFFIIFLARGEFFVSFNLRKNLSKFGFRFLVKSCYIYDKLWDYLLKTCLYYVIVCETMLLLLFSHFIWLLSIFCISFDTMFSKYVYVVLLLYVFSIWS